MVEVRRRQLSFGEGLIAEEVSQLRDDWMAHADRLLEDEQLLSVVFAALCKRHRKNRTRRRLGIGRKSCCAYCFLKHIRNCRRDRVHQGAE